MSTIFCRKIEKKERFSIEIPVPFPVGGEPNQSGNGKADRSFLFLQKTGVKHGGVAVIRGGEMKDDFIAD